jgi:integrase
VFSRVARLTGLLFSDCYPSCPLGGRSLALDTTLEASTRDVTFQALDHFERIINPKLVSGIKTQTLDDCKAKRCREPGRKKGAPVSVATIDKELRHIRAVLRIAQDWKYLPELPRVRMLKEPSRLATYVTPEHFAAMYRACDTARMPEGFPFPPSAWWRGLLVTGYMTGWRVSEILAMKREDLDLDTATAIMWYVDNKGKREERVKLHPVVIDHLRALPGFDPFFFPWNHNRRTLDDEIDRIQVTAGIHLTCKKSAARADRRLPRLQLPRPAPRLRHAERPPAYIGRPAEAHAARELRDDAEVHQHGAAAGRRGGGPGRAGNAAEARDRGLLRAM